MTMIQSGTGNGQFAKVTEENELLVRAITEDVIVHRVDEGAAFNVETGLISLTDANPTAVLYIKNQDVNDMVITSATISSGNATGAADNFLLVSQVGNFDAGSDIILNGTDGIAFNRNSGKTSRVFNGIIKVGGTGRSFTNEIATQEAYGDFTMSRQIPLSSFIPVGGEVGVVVTPPAANTAMPFLLSVNFHIKETL